jgi:tetratricopeptide (TPR) repeat protein
MKRRLILALLVLPWLGGGLLFAKSGELEDYLSRGRALSKGEKTDQALPYFLLALELAEAQYGKDSPRIVPVLEDLADAHAAQKQYRDAEPLYDRALKIQEREAAHYQAGIVRVSNRLGTIYEETGRKREAMALYRNVLEVWAPVLGAGQPDVQEAGRRLAKLALQVPTTPGEVTPARPPPVARPPTPLVPPAPPPVAAAPKPKPAPVPAPTPAPVPAQKPMPAPAAEGGYLIHLTSIRNPADAEAEWARLKRLYGKLLKGLHLTVTRVDLGPPRGVYYRIKGGPLNRAGAKERCAVFEARGVWCRVVAAKPGAKSAPPRQPAPPVAERRTKKPSGEDYRIHLTSIRDPDKAAYEWRRLHRLYGHLLAGLSLTVKRVDLGARGIYYRIEGGPLSHDAARKLCAKFAAKNVWCGIVPPPRDPAETAQRLAVQSARRVGPTRLRGTRRPIARRFRRRADLCHARTLRRDRGCRRMPGRTP